MPARWRDRGSKDPADAVGLACLKTASKQCSECDADLCESHVETCAMCRAVFFPPCLSLHQGSTRKPPQRIANNIGSEGVLSPAGRNSPLSEQESLPRTELHGLYTGIQRDIQRSNDGRTPETYRRPDSSGSGISSGLQRGHRPTPEKEGRVPG